MKIIYPRNRVLSPTVIATSGDRYIVAVQRRTTTDCDIVVWKYDNTDFANESITVNYMIIGK